MEGALLVEGAAVRRLPVEKAGDYRGPGFLWVHLKGSEVREHWFRR